MNTRFGHVTYTKLGIRHATLEHFLSTFNIGIDILQSNKTKILKDIILDPNFVFFLMENKTFILLYEKDYYSDKSIEIIANKIQRTDSEIEKYLSEINYKIREPYPYRYISSYSIDYKLGGKYEFLSYTKHHIYEGNYECRRRNIFG